MNFVVRELLLSNKQTNKQNMKSSIHPSVIYIFLRERDPFLPRSLNPVVSFVPFPVRKAGKSLPSAFTSCTAFFLSSISIFPLCPFDCTVYILHPILFLRALSLSLQGSWKRCDRFDHLHWDQTTCSNQLTVDFFSTAYSVGRCLHCCVSKQPGI